jgi:hypothetical protein
LATIADISGGSLSLDSGWAKKQNITDRDILVKHNRHLIGYYFFVKNVA